MTTTATAKTTSNNNKVWIVQQQRYYYSDGYCAHAQDPDGWFRTKDAAKKFCGQKNLGAIRQYVKDNKDDMEDDNPALLFMNLPEECQLKIISKPKFSPESDLGIDSADCNLDWYEVVELKLLDDNDDGK